MQGVAEPYPSTGIGRGPDFNRVTRLSGLRVTLVAGLCLGLELAALDRLLGRAQVTQLDQGRLVVSLLAPRLEEDLLGLADESQDDHEAGAAALDRIDRGLRRGERQERDDLAEVLAKLLTEGLGRLPDVARDQRRAHCYRALSTLRFFHSSTSDGRRPSARSLGDTLRHVAWRGRRGGRRLTAGRPSTTIRLVGHSMAVTE